MRATRKALEAVPEPFDQAILGEDTAPGRVAVKAAVDELHALAALFVEAAAKFGITLNLEPPE